MEGVYSEEVYICHADDFIYLGHSIQRCRGTIFTGLLQALLMFNLQGWWGLFREE